MSSQNISEIVSILNTELNFLMCNESRAEWLILKDWIYKRLQMERKNDLNSNKDTIKSCVDKLNDISQYTDSIKISMVARWLRHIEENTNKIYYNYE